MDLRWQAVESAVVVAFGQNLALMQQLGFGILRVMRVQMNGHLLVWSLRLLCVWQLVNLRAMNSHVREVVKSE
ncbi:hypothetical protein JTE90_009733 [Oedothorax gibbosus]|uniref:Uncharacterized protein n=1 Tax=Oedothorax gibbosus TaxID=931172 RepID=A0AAV6V9V4_9ARAC|nr:hypothetical protein JTE90_009733 [Oedothorax gibbosus]